LAITAVYRPGKGADDILADLENEKKELLASAAEKEKLLKVKVKTIGNIVHESVPVSNNEVWKPSAISCEGEMLTKVRTTTLSSGPGPLRALPLRSVTFCRVRTLHPS